MRLSICIPTFNRADYLPTLLDSILAQEPFACELEIVISDNASSDGTQAVLEQYGPRFERFVHHRMERNMGADLNFLKVVELASGEFCWLMGSDDKIEPGGVAAVERRIAADRDVAGLSARTRAYDSRLEALIPLVASDRYPPGNVVLEGAEHIFTQMDGYLGFLSSNIVDRALWNMVCERYDLVPYMDAWVHVYVMGRMMQHRPRWGFVAQPSVGWRSGNDSFVAEGMYRRLELDIASYAKVTAGLFGKESPAYRKVMGNRIETAFFKLFVAKMNEAPRSYFQAAWTLLYRYLRSYPRFWLIIAPLFATPGFVPRWLHRTYRGTIKGFRARKLNPTAASQDGLAGVDRRPPASQTRKAK